jgi:aspartate kinase
MKVYKFGGASIKNAEAICNLKPILAEICEPTLVVVSALGKTTNALENLLYAYLNQSDNRDEHFQRLYQEHFQLIDDLLPHNEAIRKDLQHFFDQLQFTLQELNEQTPDQSYDQVVSFGELFSTCIIAAWLNEHQIPTQWLDIRDILITDDWHRNARIRWEPSLRNVKKIIPLKSGMIYLTQGFIGRSESGNTTTLGREGSAYTAAALAYMLDAEEMIVWKDVQGVFSADPAEYENASLIPELSYSEAIELSFFGAKIIHPKTIKPLQNKRIPLKVKSFLNPQLPGTIIHDTQSKITYPPILILKKNQLLISISPKDFSFISDDHLSIIFSIFAQHRLKINVSENSALSFTVCTDNDPNRVGRVLDTLRQDYLVKFNENLELLTIRHYRDDLLKDLQKGSKILLEQRNRTTLRLVSSN